MQRQVRQCIRGANLFLDSELKTPLARSSQCFPLERCSLGTCVEQTVQDIMYNGMDYSQKGPGDDEENAEANDTAREIGTGSGNGFDAEGKSPDPRYPHMLKYPESSAPEDCLYEVKWGGNPGEGKVDFEIRSKRKSGIVGFCSTKETVRESLVKEYFI